MAHAVPLVNYDPAILEPKQYPIITEEVTNLIETLYELLQGFFIKKSFKQKQVFEEIIPYRHQIHLNMLLEQIVGMTLFVQQKLIKKYSDDPGDIKQHDLRYLEDFEVYTDQEVWSL